MIIRLMVAWALATPTLAADPLRQLEYDSYRRAAIKNELGLPSLQGSLQSDGAALVDLSFHTDGADARVYPPLPNERQLQIFSNGNVAIRQIFEAAESSAGYTVRIHPSVNVTEIVSLNTRANPMSAIASYISRVTNAHVTHYPEARVLLVFPDGDTS